MSESRQHEDYRCTYDRRLWSAAWSLGFLLLMPPGLAVGQTDEEIEQVFWESVECTSALQVQAYFEVYPTGRYLAEAHACLEGQLSLERAERILVQRGLAVLDYSPGPADGLFGGATRAAVRQWQRAKGEPVTGYLTRAQADALIAQGRKRAQAVSSPCISPDQTCEGRSKGDQCWMELANQVGCYVWNPGLVPDASVTWTGKCSRDFAHGKGTLTWVWEGNKNVSTHWTPSWRQAAWPLGHPRTGRRRG